MSDTLLQLLATYGAPLLALTTFASCLALPVPSSLMMLAAGAFVASGDLSASAVAAAAFARAVAGDQLGYFAGRGGGAFIERKLASRPKRRRLYSRARAYLLSHGNYGVFLTRWLFSPLGPYANLAAGAARLSWARFTLWAAAGEALWVALYVTLGQVFSHNLMIASDLITQVLGLLAALGSSFFLGRWLLKLSRQRARR